MTQLYTQIMGNLLTFWSVRDDRQLGEIITELLIG